MNGHVNHASALVVCARFVGSLGQAAARLARRPILLATLSVSVGILVSPAVAEFQIVAFSDTPSPDGNGKLLTFTPPALSDTSQVAFLSQLGDVVDPPPGGSIALFRGSTTGLEVAARTGELTVDDTPLVSFLNNSPSINSAGLVSHSGRLDDASQEIVAFVNNGGVIEIFPRVGTPSPSGNNALIVRTLPVINDAGVAVYRGLYTGSDPEMGNPELGIYARSLDGTITTRVLQGSPAPRGGEIELITNSLPTLNANSQIGLIGRVDDTVVTRTSVMRLDGTTVVELARDGDMANDGTSTIDNILYLSHAAPLNDGGQMAFAGNYSQSEMGPSRPGVFRAGVGGIDLLTPDPFLPGTSVATSTLRVLDLNNSGQALFAADFAGGGDPLSGIYVAGDAGPQLVALEDAATPAGNKYFRRFFNESIALDESGRVAFMAELSDSPNGPLAERGLFLYSAQSGLQQVVGKGDSLAGSTVLSMNFTGTFYTLAGPSSSYQPPDEHFSGLNNLGQLAFSFSLASGESGVALWSPTASNLPGDYSGNGAVENADLTLLLNNWAATVPPTPAGWNGTAPTGPAVDNDELTLLLNNWGQSVGVGSVAAVPEPASASLALIVAISACFRRPWRRLFCSAAGSAGRLP